MYITLLTNVTPINTIKKKKIQIDVWYKMEFLVPNFLLPSTFLKQISQVEREV